MKKLSILTVLAVATLVAGLSLKSELHAQQSPSAGTTSNAGWFPRAGRFLRARRPLARLNLSDAQKQAGLAVLRNHQSAIKPLVDNLVKERSALRALFKAPAVDEAAVRAESGRVAAIEADLAVQKAYLLHDLRAVATAEQLRTLDEMQANAETHFSEVMEKVNDWIANS